MNVMKRYEGKKVFILTTNKRTYSGKVIDVDDIFLTIFTGIKEVTLRIETLEEIKEEE